MVTSLDRNEDGSISSSNVKRILRFRLSKMKLCIPPIIVSSAYALALSALSCLMAATLFFTASYAAPEPMARKVSFTDVAIVLGATLSSLMSPVSL